ncbi:DUF5666 domain-containing protein [Tunturiibacter gelidoferens]|uniref:DUF5666 domain-containing protein n=1 Tax=Tunturiibacter gelidiferens TaxID=3069689 RepID=A0AAU7YV95_9BACT
MKKVLATLFTIVLMVSSAYAHNGMEHVMGTVASVTDNSITVTTKDGKSQTIATTADTKYTRMDKVIAMKDIKAGDQIVIHATKKGDQLTAAEVKVGAMKMNGMSGDMGGMKMDHDNGTTPPK